MKDEISLVLSCDDNFAQHAGVLMESVLSNAKHPKRFHFYVINGGISSIKQHIISNIVDTHSAKISYLKIDEQIFKDAYISYQYTQAIYYRLCIGSLLPSTVSRCLYLDCDMVCCSDLEDIWNEDLQGHVLGAIIDHAMMVSDKRWNAKKEELGFDNKDLYFNSGFLLIDVEKWRKGRFDEKAIELIKNKKFKNHDQDILNVLFKRKWKVLHAKWNCMPAICGFNNKLFVRRKEFPDILEARKEPAILHFAGRYKPWEYPERKRFNDKYYHYLRNTEFYKTFQPKRSAQNSKKNGLSELLRIYLGDFMFYLVKD